MKFKLSGSENYAARIVKIKNINTLEGMNNLAATYIFGQQVLVGKNTAVGTLGIYFPIETSIDAEFLSKNNLFRHSEKNLDTSRKGCFEDNRRVKCQMFAGHKSEGFFIPIESLSYLGDLSSVKEGIVFDTVDSKPICKKYKVESSDSKNSKGSKNKKAQNKIKKFDKMIDGQFKFHHDTSLLFVNLFKLKPDSIIGVSEKYHGSSFIVSNILTKRPLTTFEKIAKWFKVAVNDTQYDCIAASRTVIKNKYINQSVDGGYYKFDIWSDIKDKIKDRIPKNYTVYGEVFGYLPTGGMLQKGYHYGCDKGEYRIIVYRVTVTNPDGNVLELTEPQIVEFCNKNNLPCKHMWYHGKARDLFPDIPVDDNWADNFHERLRVSYNLEKMCPLNNNEVPAEGVVLRIDSGLDFNAFKVKSFLFNKRETKMLDKGEVDIESEQSNVEDVDV